MTSSRARPDGRRVRARQARPPSAPPRPAAKEGQGGGLQDGVQENGARESGGLRESSRRTREAVLEAATAEFAEKGFDGARVEEIAARTGIRKNVLYYYFGSKEGLFTAVLERTYGAIRAAQEDMNLRGMDPVQGMRRLVLHTGTAWGRHPEFLRLLQSENLHRGRHVRGSAAIRRMYNPLLETIRGLLERGVAAGVFRAGIDPVELYISVTSLTAHYVSHQHTFEAIFGAKLLAPGRLRQRLEHAADMVIRYLLANDAGNRATGTVERASRR